VLCLPCSLLPVAGAASSAVALCTSCQGGLCLDHWREHLRAEGPGGMRLACEHLTAAETEAHPVSGLAAAHR